jgi:thiamine biosynthesis protein ThiI
MKFVVKYFSEITIKSKPVRRRFVGQLVDNLRALLRETDPDVVVQRNWDKLQIETRLEDPVLLARMVEGMRNAPGITYILQVVEHPLPDLEDIVEYVLPVYEQQLEGRNFAVASAAANTSSPRLTWNAWWEVPCWPGPQPREFG